jgi:hypothetical protein
MNRKNASSNELLENSSLSKFESASVSNDATKSKLAVAVSTTKTTNDSHSKSNVITTTESSIAAIRSSKKNSTISATTASDAIVTNMFTKINRMLPPLHKGEYDVIMPIISNKGYMIDVALIRSNNTLRFRGYKKFPYGSSDPAESMKLIRGIGDQIIAVDGILTKNRSIEEIIFMIKDSAKTIEHKFAIFRFCEDKYITKTSSSTTTTTMEQ